MIQGYRTAMIALIVIFAGLGFLPTGICGVEPLTVMLAASPGGADSVAMIAASSNVQLPFVVAMQTAEFILILASGSVLARFLARRLTSIKEASE